MEQFNYEKWKLYLEKTGEANKCFKRTSWTIFPFILAWNGRSKVGITLPAVAAIVAGLHLHMGSIGPMINGIEIYLMMS